MRVTGLKTNLRNANKLTKVAQKTPIYEFRKCGRDIVTYAKARLVSFPSDGEEMVERINSTRSSIKHKTYGSDSQIITDITAGGSSKSPMMAAYLEFGTGKFATSYLNNRPSWVKQWASEFYVDGSGTMKVHAYIYPSINDALPVMIKRIENKINKAWTT